MLKTASKNFAGLTMMVKIYIGLVVVIAGGLLIAPFVITPTYLNLYRDFGSLESLPPITRLVCQTWFPILLSLVTLGLVASGLFSRASEDKRRTLIMVSVFLAMAFTGLYLYGLYAPVFELASAAGA